MGGPLELGEGEAGDPHRPTEISTPRTDQIDHDVDHLAPHLPLREVVQDLYSTDPTQETFAVSCRLYGFHATLA